MKGSKPETKRATRKQEASEIGGTGPAQRAEAWGPEIAPPAGEKMIKDTEEMVRFPNWMNVTSSSKWVGEPDYRRGFI